MLRTEEPTVHFCITATTRSPRPGERDGVDYLFYSEPEFLLRAERGEFLEFARVPPIVGNLYGTPEAEVYGPLSRGCDVFLQVDVQGARSVRAKIPTAVSIFLRPPDIDALRRRLSSRGTETNDDLERRLANAMVEMASEPEFTYTVINAEGRLSAAVAHVRAIMTIERARWRASRQNS